MSGFQTLLKISEISENFLRVWLCRGLGKIFFKLQSQSSRKTLASFLLTLLCLGWKCEIILELRGWQNEPIYATSIWPQYFLCHLCVYNEANVSVVVVMCNEPCKDWVSSLEQGTCSLLILLVVVVEVETVVVVFKIILSC